MLNRKLSRRSVMAGLGGLVAAPMLGVSRARAAGSIVAAAFPGSWEDSYRTIVGPVVKSAGTELVLAPALAQDQLARLRASQSQSRPAYDAMMVSPGQTTDAIAHGLIEKIDPSKLKNWSKLLPAAQTEWGPNVTVEITGIAYNPKLVPKPKTYRELFDNPVYHGKVGWSGFGSNTATIAWVEIAKAFGGSEDNLSPAFKILAEHLNKGAVITSNNQQQMALYQQNEIAVFISTVGNVANLRGRGVECDFAHPTTGSPALPVALHLVKGSPNPDGVYQYMDAAISADVQRQLSMPPNEVLPTNTDVPLTDSLKSFISDADIKNLIYPNWAKINPNRAAWSAEFDRVVKK
ncbi:MAG: extracellular solute-binding protein [Alphaproteobacteria bacterium]|nr:extracellular solute-binding protein [Alphaproteobacteria bacterium]